MADDSTTDGTTQDGGAATATDATSTERADLGDAGKKALQEERRKARDAQKQLNEAMARLKEYEDRDKTETQRLAERADEAERTAAAARQEALRYRIAAKHGISDDDAELFLTGADEATLTRQAERLAKRAADDITTNGAYVPSEGRGPARPAALNSDQLEQALRAKLGI